MLTVQRLEIFLAVQFDLEGCSKFLRNVDNIYHFYTVRHLEGSTISLTQTYKLTQLKVWHFLHNIYEYKVYTFMTSMASTSFVNRIVMQGRRGGEVCPMPFSLTPFVAFQSIGSWVLVGDARKNYDYSTFLPWCRTRVTSAYYTLHNSAVHNACNLLTRPFLGEGPAKVRCLLSLAPKYSILWHNIALFTETTFIFYILLTQI